jgi:ABC-type sugar transport system permease subunit
MGGGDAMSLAATTTVLKGQQKPTATQNTAERRRTIRTAFAFLAPSLLGVILFLLIPIVFVVFLSLVQWNLLTPMKWVGLSNYANIFKFDGFGHSLLVTAYYVLLNIPVQTALALGMAMLLHRNLAGSGLIRVIAVLPFLSTPVAMGVVWNWIFNPTGIVNQFLAHLGVTGPGWLTDRATAMPVIAFANIWQYAGYNMLFFLAGLSAIPLSLYEAASLDGANRWEQFRRVTLPLLRPTMLFVLVTGVIGSFQVFDTVYVMTAGGPGNSTQVANLNIYSTAFAGFRIGEASAMSVVLFLLILAVTIMQFRWFNKRITYEIA